MSARATVPCGSCRLCCINAAIVLHPQCGDIVETYERRATAHPLTGETVFMLKHKPNGDCVYLGPDGCTIHDRAPAICKEFDCRRAFLKFRRHERKQLVRSGAVDQATFDAGKQRLHTLENGA